MIDFTRNARKALSKLNLLPQAPAGAAAPSTASATTLAAATSQPEAPSMKIVSEEECPAYIARNLAEASNDLERIYYQHTGRRIFKWHRYLEFYDRCLHLYREVNKDRRPRSMAAVAPGGKLRILEIGVQNGGSLQLWRQYFGPNAVIFGIDLDPNCKNFEEDNCQIRIGDQADPAFLASVVAEMGSIDIVIDDGSHRGSQQLASFRHLYPHLVAGGTYICEDLHTSYWDDWEGGFRRPGTFIEAIKDMIDEMHGWYWPMHTQFTDMNLKRSIYQLTVCDSTVAIEKRTVEEPYVVQVGTSSY